MANTHFNSRLGKHHGALRTSGLQPVQIWVPDTSCPGFAEDCRQQSHVAAEADEASCIQDLMDESLGDIDGWTE